MTATRQRPKTRKANHRVAGFTLLEATVALTILVLGALLVVEALISSESAARADSNKSQAVRSCDSCLRVLGQELVQTSSSFDPALPPDDQQRIWVLSNGIRFQKVVGYEMDALGGVTQRWSPMITYTVNNSTGELWRTQAGDGSRLMARGVADFDINVVPGGHVTVTLETRRGSQSRGVEGVHRRTARFTPLNALD